MAQLVFPWLRDRIAFIVVITVLVGVKQASGQLAPIQATTDLGALLNQPRPLMLVVTVNGKGIDAPQPFVLAPPRRLSAERRVLENIGIAVPGDAAPAALVDLDSLPPDVTHTFDEATQAVTFDLPDQRRQRRSYDARTGATGALAPKPDWGGFLNYSLFASESQGHRNWFRFSGANASLDGHVFGPYGTFDQSMIVGNTVGDRKNALRLETGYSFFDQDRMVAGRIGDTVSSGLAWSRPIRMGGVQAQRDFGLQPGLVTQPLPAFSGSAAVPSTVDVFVGSTKLFSQHVDPGPYQLLNIPSVTNGSGNVVVTDAAGRQTEASLPLYDVAKLLRPSFTDFSVEAGFARRDFGLTSDDYDPRPVAAVTVRRGITPTLTLDSHVEAGAGVIDVGTGATVGTPWGTIQGAISVSQEHRSGAQLYVAYDVQLWAGTLIHASVQQRTSFFDDLAGATARYSGLYHDLGFTSAQNLDAVLQSLTAYKPPKRLSQLSVSTPLPLWGGTASVSLIDEVDASNTSARIAAVSVSHPLPYQASIYATAFANLAGRGGGGVLAGLSIPLGTDTTVDLGRGTGSGSAIVQKSLGQEAGSVGWQLADLGTNNAERLASAAYRSSVGTASASLTQDHAGVGGTVGLEGSVGVMGSTVALGNRVQDGFAIVDAGLPDVAVLRDNRRIGTTDPWGHLLVSGLSTYQADRIGIDPLSMPIHADADSNEATVVPARSSGVLVKFGGEREDRSRLIVIVDNADKPLPPGSKGHLGGSDETFVLGYGGQAYLRHLKDSNEATIETATGTCRIVFPLDASTPANTLERTVRCS